MIIVSGLNRKTGQVRTQTFLPGKEGNARYFRRHLRELGYTTTFVNDVKEMYRARAAGGMRDPRQHCRKMRHAFTRPGEPTREHMETLNYEGIVGFQLHSAGTKSGNLAGKHYDGSNNYEDAVAIAEAQVAKWSDSHKGIVIYKPIALIRKITKPTTEIVELS